VAPLLTAGNPLKRILDQAIPPGTSIQNNTIYVKVAYFWRLLASAPVCTGSGMAICPVCGPVRAVRADSTPDSRRNV